jgi:hypothetical protein
MDFWAWWLTVDWGDAAGWVSGVATTIAVSVGVVQLRNERRRDRELEERLHQDQTRAQAVERRAQAIAVSAWFDGETLVVRNDSGGLIYDVFAVMVDGRSESDGKPMQPSMGKSGALPPEFSALLELVPPKSSASVAIGSIGWGAAGFAASYDLNFRDSAGVTWFRNNWGNCANARQMYLKHMACLDRVATQPPRSKAFNKA